MKADVTVARIADDTEVEAYAQVLAAAFLNYPVMVKTFGNAPGNRIDWILRMTRQAIRTRLVMGVPWLVASKEGVPVGVALLSLSTHPTPPELRAKFDEILADAGPESVLFIERFIAATEVVSLPDPHVYLAILGVHPDFQGQGIGRQLLEETMVIAQAIPACKGVGLDTEDETNVRIYESCGFQVLGQGSVDELPVYILWRDA
ncbi:MAG: GNAT family N-acetyltransferase [Fimbriimonas sp.]